MEACLNIKNIELQVRGECYQISADVGFQSLWFRIPKNFKPDILDASPFLVSALLPAMLLGQDIVVNDNYFVSKKIMQQIDYIQEIYNEWNPSFKIINISAPMKEVVLNHSEVGSFFSGGVDGTYTMMKHLEDIDYLILINGFDFGMGNKTWSTMFERNQLFVEHFDKQLIGIETNFKTFILNYGIARVANYGACLVAIGLILGFERLYLSSATTFSLIKPDGSHPLFDHLWNTEKTAFIHSGLEADRSKKIETLKANPFALSQLWVCWNTPKVNCGKCSKCIRTYIALLLNGAEDLISFQSVIDIRKLANIPIANECDYNFYSKFREKAVDQGHKLIQSILNRMLFKYKFKLFLLDCEKYLLNEYFTRRKQQAAKEKDLEVKVSTTSRYSDNYVIEQVLKLKKESDIQENNSIVGSIYFNDPKLDNDTVGEVPTG